MTEIREFDRQLYHKIQMLDIPGTLALLDGGASINVLDESGETPFMELAGVKYRPDGRHVSQKERIKFMNILIERGADIDLFGLDGHNALWYAIVYGEYKVVKFLLNSGVNLNVEYYPDEGAEGPLDTAYMELHCVTTDAKYRTVERIIDLLELYGAK